MSGLVGNATKIEAGGVARGGGLGLGLQLGKKVDRLSRLGVDTVEELVEKVEDVLSGRLRLRLRLRMRLRLRSTTRLYAFGALLASVVLSVGWLAVSWMAVSGIDNNDGVDDDPDSSMPIFYILYAVAVPVNVTVFVFAVAVAALMAHISRAQVVALAVSMEDGTLSMERVVRKHATMARLARRLSSLMQSFVVPVFIIFPLSISYQLWDAARASERADNELNGKYYLVIYALALILVATIFTSINRKFSSLTDTAAQLHRVGSHSFTDINTLLGYLAASRPPFLIMGAAPSPAIVPILILAFFGVVGTLIHQVSL